MPVLLFLVVYFFSGLSTRSTSFDSRWTVYIAMSLWLHGDTNLDEYPRAILYNNYYALECVDSKGQVRRGPPPVCDGHWYSSYPIGGSVFSAPMIGAAVLILKIAHPFLQLFHSQQPIIQGFLDADFDWGHPVIEMECASFLLATTAVLLYFIAMRFLPSERAWPLAALFAIGTSAYSVAGRALWQHTPSMLLITLVIYMMLRAEEKPSLAGWAGIPVALAYTVRPTDALFVVLITSYVFVRHRKYLLPYLLGAIPIAIVFFLYNESVYHSLLSPYYQTPLDGFRPENWPRFRMGLASNLIGPSRGLFIYTPIFLLSVWSMIRGMWKPPIARWLAVLVLLHWLAVSSYVANWWAGHSYGPRFFTDMTPILALFLIPYLQRWDSYSRGFRVAFVALALIGVAMHVRGGWSVAVYEWNVKPENVDQHPDRNWNWTDPPFLR